MSEMKRYIAVGKAYLKLIQAEEELGYVVIDNAFITSLVKEGGLE